MEKLRTIYAHILIFLCIYIEWGYTIVVANYLSGTLRSIILLAAIIPLFFLYETRQTNLSLALLFYSFLIILLNLGRDYAAGDYLLLFLPVLLGYFIATRIPTMLCIRSFCNIVYFLAIYSLLFYIICAVFPFFCNLLPVIGYFQDSILTMHNALFTVVINGMQFPRNFGITWEPGAFAILLCIAIFCTIFCYDKIDKKRILIYSVAIITTFSTMGYIVLAILFVSFLGMRKKGNAGLILLSFIIVVAALQIPFMKELTFGKLEGLVSSPNNVVETTEARLNAIIYPGMAFIENPFFGVGYSEFEFINEFLCNNVATNTIINWLAIFGVLLGFPFIFFYMFTIYRIQKQKIHWLFIMLILIGAVFLVSTESLLRISLIYVIIFIGTLNSREIKMISND